MDEPAATGPAGATIDHRTVTRRAALIEVHERDAHGRVALRSVPVSRWPLTIGRALDNDLVLDDPYVAPHHAVIERAAGDDGGGADATLVLRVLDTVNGVGHDGVVVARNGHTALGPGGAALQIGATRLKLRLPGEVLAAEKVLPGVVPGQRLKLAAVALALLALVLAEHWIALDPGADLSAWLAVVVGVPLAVVGWSGVWALVSKLFQHRFDFGGHLRIALPWLLGLSLAAALQPVLAAMLAWPWLWQATGPVQALLLALLVRAHLVHVLPQHPRIVGATVAALLLVGGGVQVAMTWRAMDALRPLPYMSTLPPPALRLAGTVPPQTLAQDVGPLVAAVQRRVQQAHDDEGDADGP